MGFSSCIAVCCCDQILPRHCERSNPSGRTRSMDCFVASLLAMPAWLSALLSRHLLRALPEHIPPRFLIERLFHELADRKPGLHLRPRADISVPALDVRVVVERKPCALWVMVQGKQAISAIE